MQKFFKDFSISLPHLKSLSFFITGLISAESVVTADVSRKLKDVFSLIQLESVERRFRLFFKSFSSLAYSFYDAFIRIIVSKFKVKHADKKVHIVIGLIDNLCHEIVYHKHKELDYDIMTDVVVNEIVNILNCNFLFSFLFS